jgi:hypothetical protein
LFLEGNFTAEAGRLDQALDVMARLAPHGEP